MIHPGLAVQSALHSHLVSEPQVTSVLDGAAIYDDVPRGAKPPYVTFGTATHFEWNTGTEEGMEHFIALNVWSDEQGRKQVLEIAQVIEGSIFSLDDQLQDHVLVNLTHESTEVSKDVKSDLYLARINLRVVTEPQ